MVKLQWPWNRSTQSPLEASHVPGYGKKEDIGEVAVTYAWTDRTAHPKDMANYNKWANDPEANIALNVLTDNIAGVGFHTDMPEDPTKPEGKGKDKPEKEHPHKTVIDEYCERVNLDEDLPEIVQTMLTKGFCPVERLSDYDLKPLPPETFFIWRTKRGHIYRYTQERSQGNITAYWEEPDWQKSLESCKEAYKPDQYKEYYTVTLPKDLKAGNLEDVIMFYHRRNTSHPYGKSLLEPIGSLLDTRNTMNSDIGKVLHRLAYPIPIMETSRDKASLETAITERDVDEWILIGNVQDGEIRWKPLEITSRAAPEKWIDLINVQICEGLHAPLLLYLKNATEASATVMMESVDRLINGIQRGVKRRVERYLFEPQCGEPVPRVVWGQPKTGLEEVSLTDIASILPNLPRNQKQFLLKKFFPDMPEPEIEPVMPFPMQKLPFQKQQEPQLQVPNEQVIEKLNDLGTALSIVETNYREHRLELRKAVELGAKAIEVHLRRIHGSGQEYEAKRQEEYDRWVRRLLQIEPLKGKTDYHVTVG